LEMGDVWGMVGSWGQATLTIWPMGQQQ